MVDSNEANKAKARAEASFRRKEQAEDSTKAWAEYRAERVAVVEKTERLRALRLAKEAAEAEGGKELRRATKRLSPRNAGRSGH